MPADMGPMERFAADLLARQGALVEPIEPEGLEVLAPPPLQKMLGVPELVRLGFGATLPENAQRVGIESDWLERFAKLMGDHGRWSRRVLDGSGTLADPQSMLAQKLPLDNATFRLIGQQPAWTRYLVLDFRYSAISDEKRDGMVRLMINLTTGVLPDAVLARVAPWIDAPEQDVELPANADLPPNWEQSRMRALLGRALLPRLDASLTPFVRSLRRRLERDQERLHAYHNDLFQEARRRAFGLPENDAVYRREQARAEAIEREYQARLDDLTHKYAMRVTVEWVRSLELIMPVERLEVQIRRRKAERVIRLDWNRLARRLEHPVCEDNFGLDRPRLTCDEALHLVSASGLDPCPNCGRIWCRACHSDACPRCGFKVQMPTLGLSN